MGVRHARADQLTSDALNALCLGDGRTGTSGHGCGAVHGTEAEFVAFHVPVTLTGAGHRAERLSRAAASPPDLFSKE